MDSIEDYNDINTHGEYKMALDAGLTEEDALQVCYINSRDNARTPMQWDETANAGFTSGKPWLKVTPNYKELNVKTELGDENSVLSYYKKLIALRKSENYKEVFTYGTFVPIFENEPDIFAYERRLDNQSVIVLANFGKEAKTLILNQIADRPVLLTNQPDVQIADNQITLKSCQVIVAGTTE